MNKQKKRLNTMLFLTGAIAGAATTYYLTTPQGKKLTKKVVNKGKEASESIINTATELKEQTVNKVGQLSDNIKERTSDIIANTSEKYAAVKNKLSNKSDDYLEEVEGQIDNIAIGVDRAKRAMRNEMSSN